MNVLYLGIHPQIQALKKKWPRSNIKEDVDKKPAYMNIRGQEASIIIRGPNEEVYRVRGRG